MKLKFQVQLAGFCYIPNNLSARRSVYLAFLLIISVAFLWLSPFHSLDFPAYVVMIFVRYFCKEILDINRVPSRLFSTGRYNVRVK